jgi:hypothetical protein
MLKLISIVFHFVATASDPSWSCQLTYREPNVAGTFYFRCSKMTPDGVELVQVGRFISDEKAAELAAARQ